MFDFLKKLLVFTWLYKVLLKGTTNQ